MSFHLNNRIFTFKCFDTKNKFFFQKGVPQGSSLGPLLFSLYINDIGLNFEDQIKYLLYADDVIIFNAGTDLNDMQNKLQRSLDNLETWCKKNSLIINETKTKVMIFSKKRDNEANQYEFPNLTLLVNNNKLEVVKTFKYLGVIFDYHLSFDNQFNSVNSKLTDTSTAMSRIRC